MIDLRKVLADHKLWACGDGGNRADLRDADLHGADLRGADLRGADLRGADLRSAHLTGAHLRYAYLTGADLRGADLRDAGLHGAYLRGAYLRSADLRYAHLTGAHLRGADLRGADLRGADLHGADFFGAKNAPLVMTGSKHLVVHHAPGHIAVGCECHTYAHWQEHIEKIGRDNDYTKTQIAEYKTLVTCASVQGRMRDNERAQ